MHVKGLMNMQFNPCSTDDFVGIPCGEYFKSVFGIPFIDDWSEADYEILITCLKNTAATGGLLYGFFDGNNLYRIPNAVTRAAAIVVIYGTFALMAAFRR